MAEPRAAVRAAGRRLMRRGASGVRRTVAQRPRLLVFIAILGPGMITANAGNDAGGIATFASIGAEFGYSLLWVLIPITISLGIVQEMCARDRKSTRLNSSHSQISYAVFCLKKK